MIPLTVRSPSSTTTDDLGNPVVVWVERVWTAWGMAPGIQSELRLLSMAGREAVPIAWTLYGPLNDAQPLANDEVRVGGAWLAVDGEPQDWTRGPWGAGNAGLVVELRTVQG